MLYEGAQFGHSGEVNGGSEEEMDFLGIPGLLEPDQVRELLHSRQSERAASRRPTVSATESSTRCRSSARTSSSACCGASSTASSPPGTTGPARPTASPTTRSARSAAGPPAAVANAEQLHERINRIREWAVRKTS